MQTGQHTTTTGAKIAGIVSCVPPRIVDNAHFEKTFGADAVRDVAKMIGVEKRHYVEPGVATSDLCHDAANRLMDELGWERDSVDGIIFVSQSADYLLPATSCMLQNRLGLRKTVFAYDVSLGCSGYPYGLWLAMMAVQTGAMKRVLLAVGDVSTRRSDPTDRATVMLFGDAGTVTAIEHAPGEVVNFVLGTDGSGAENLIIPSSWHRERKAEGRLEGRNLEMLYMDGGEIFNFTLKSVPPLIRDTLEAAGKTVEDYDAFLLHQANAFMIRHIAKKAKLPPERTPINMDRFGNTSSASIPLLMTTDVAASLKSGRRRIAMFGFGVGYSWGAASMEVGPLDCCETIILGETGSGASPQAEPELAVAS
ncbi:MAG TPA: ketoacyl-ACP synthase III [Allosphingosinicella sp.]